MPRPIICQNFVLDRTSLKKTRLTTSGMSMPVSSMSTEIAMCGALSGSEKSSISDCAYVTVVGDDAGELARRSCGVVDVEALLR